MADMTFKANLYPDSTSFGYSLGSSTNKWKIYGDQYQQFDYLDANSEETVGSYIRGLIDAGYESGWFESVAATDRGCPTEENNAWYTIEFKKNKIGNAITLIAYKYSTSDIIYEGMLWKNGEGEASWTQIMTQTNADSRYVNVSGDTMTGNLLPTSNLGVSLGSSSYNWKIYGAIASNDTLAGTNFADALSNYFSANKTNIARNSLLTYYSSAYNNGTQLFGYFLNGYNDNPYGGFYVCHYNTPRYVGISNGSFTEQVLLTDSNYTNYVTKLKNITLNSTTINTETGTFAFSGSGDPWSGTDWVGLQVGDSVDKFQIHALDGAHFEYRQNDNGGSNSSWGDWQTYVNRAGDTMTGPLYINNTTDVGLNQNGALVIGTKTGYNIGIDNDEIMARNNSAASTLYLNNEGGAVRTGWLQVINNSSNNTNDAMVYLENQTNNDWAQLINLGTYNYGLKVQGTGTNLLRIGDNNTLYIGHNDAQINNTILKITNYSNTLSIGSQNSTFTHIYNSADIPFIFNKDVDSVSKNWLGSTSYPWGGLRLGGTSPSIQYQGTKANYTMIQMIDNTSDGNGNGIAIGGGGQTIIGGGESANTIAATLSKNGAEIMYVANDGDVNIFSNVQSGFSTTYYRCATLDTSARFTVKRWDNDGETGVCTYNANNGYDIRMIVNNGATPDVGIYSTKHGMWLARTTKDKYTYYADGYNGTATRLAYSQAGLAASAITWLTCWNGYELRAISKAEMANAVDSAHKWVRIGGDTMSGQLQKGSTSRSWFQGRDGAFIRNTSATYTSNYYNPILSVKSINGTWDIGTYTTNNSLYFTYITDANYNSSTNTPTAQMEFRGSDNSIRASKVYGAVWNDYAEYRKINEEEKELQQPGRCVREIGDGCLTLTTERLMRGCEIISDTFGFAIGQDKDNDYDTPIASSGRVLAYPYESLEEFAAHIGYAVCSGPGGTVSIMTDEEEEKYPLRAIGTISEIPTYEKWGTGNVDVDGRVWIRIR